MKRLLPLFIPLALAMTASPAFALMCGDGSDDSRFGIEFRGGIHFGEPYSEAEQMEFDRMELRRHGVEAERVERWNGCLRAFVRQPGGGEIMEFYDPSTFRRVR